MTSRKTTIPPLLEPYLRLPSEASLLLLTGVLNATPHWLTTRALRGAYDSWSAGDGNQDVAVVLVSWLRDFEFWKAEARRGAGLDLARLAQEDKFAFVDGLTGIFSAPSTPLSTPPGGAQPPPPQRPLQPSSPGAQRVGGIPNRTLPVRGGPIPSRGAPPPTQQPSIPQPVAATQPSTQHQKNKYTLTTPTLSHAEQTITNAITSLTTSSSGPEKKILLILDSPTTPLLLQPQTGTETSLSTLILTLRQKVHSTILSLETDLPFLSPATTALQQSQHDDNDHSSPAPKAPLETETSRFVVGQAHAARWVVGVRGLDTGVARDVSGVVRVSRGGDAGSWYDDGDEDRQAMKQAREKDMEVLYFVQADGGVRVFERGGGNIG